MYPHSAARRTSPGDRAPALTGDTIATRQSNGETSGAGPARRPLARAGGAIETGSAIEALGGLGRRVEFLSPFDQERAKGAS